jgi:hypothetical protein
MLMAVACQIALPTDRGGQPSQARGLVSGWGGEPAAIIVCADADAVRNRRVLTKKAAAACVPVGDGMCGRAPVHVRRQFRKRHPAQG